MEIIVKDGGREVVIRDQRPVLDPDMLVDMLTAVRGHLDGDDDQGVMVLPFGFTKISEESPTGQDEEDPDPASHRISARRAT